MVTAVGLQQRKNAQLAAGMSDLRRCTCLAVDWVAGTANVNVGGAILNLPMVGVPIVGFDCWVGYLAGRPIVLGAVPRSPFATVNGAPSGGLCTVLADDGGTYPVTYDTAMTVTVGLRVKVDWDCGGMIVGFPAADPYTGQSNVPAGGGTVPPVQRKTVTFKPTSSGTTNGSGLTGSGSWGSSTVWCGDTTIGAYFFGSQIANTIPNTATIRSGFISLGIAGSDYGDAPHLGTHALRSKSGVISVGNVIPISSGGGKKTLNAAILNALKTGTAYGIATAHGGYHIYGSAPGSGAITITYDL